MKKLTILLSALCIPAVAWAHNPGGAMVSWAIMFFLSLIISLFLLRRIRRHITINNKFIRFIVLFVIEIVLLILLMIIIGGTLGEWIYTYVFGGKKN